MAIRTVNAPDAEPEQKAFLLPSEGEHLFQVVDIYEPGTQTGKLVLDENTVCAKLEVAIGDELGRTILQRMTLDDQGKGFWATRLFLKAIGEPHKGQGFSINTDKWIGAQFFATVIHNGKFANIKEYNFEKSIVKTAVDTSAVKDPADIAWEE